MILIKATLTYEYKVDDSAYDEGPIDRPPQPVDLEKIKKIESNFLDNLIWDEIAADTIRAEDVIYDIDVKVEKI